MWKAEVNKPIDNKILNSFDDVFISDPSPFCFDESGQSELRDSEDFFIRTPITLFRQEQKNSWQKSLYSICEANSGINKKCVKTLNLHFQV